LPGIQDAQNILFKKIYFKTFPLKIDDIGISTNTGSSEHFQLRKSLPKHFIKINGSMSSIQ